MEATCRNEDCEKDSWELRKDPDDYARGGPTCPECGTSRIEVSGAAPDPDPQQAQQAPAQQPQQQQAQVPAIVEQGAEMGQILSGLGSDDPETQAEARGNVMQAIGGALLQVGQQEKKRGVERARRAKEGQGSVSVAASYHTCPECGQQIVEIPSGETFQCPRCGTYLEYEE